MAEKGTYDFTLENFPFVKNEDGSISNVLTEYMGVGDKDSPAYKLYPTMHKGKTLDDPRESASGPEGKHFGVFSSEIETGLYDKYLHSIIGGWEAQEKGLMPQTTVQDATIVEIFGEKSKDADDIKGFLKVLMFGKAGERDSLPYVSNDPDVSNYIRSNYQEGGEVEDRIDLGNLISTAESSSTGTWQESNITPPTGQLPSERDAMQDLHTVLGLSGMIPGIGNVADIVDASIYGLEGKGGEAALSLTSALPIAGLLAGGIKTVKGGAKAIKGVAGTMPKMSEKMPRTQTYQFSKPSPHRTEAYVPGRRDKLLEKLESDELDAFEAIDIRRQLDELEPGWERAPWLKDFYGNLE